MTRIGSRGMGILPMIWSVGKTRTTGKMPVPHPDHGQDARATHVNGYVFNCLLIRAHPRDPWSDWPGSASRESCSSCQEVILELGGKKKSCLDRIHRMVRMIGIRETRNWPRRATYNRHEDGSTSASLLQAPLSAIPGACPPYNGHRIPARADCRSVFALQCGVGRMMLG